MNAVGTVNVLEAVRSELPTARVLIASTGEVYGRATAAAIDEDAPVAPLSPYAASKAAAEIAAERARRADDLDIVVVRAFPHVGPGQGSRFAIGSWAMQIAALEASGGGVLRVGDLSVRRDLTDVRDVCNAYVHLLDASVPGRTYNVASGTAVLMADIVDLLVSMARCPITVQTDPERLRRADIPVLCGDASRLTSATGWRPRIPLETTLRDTLDEARRTIVAEAVVPG